MYRTDEKVLDFIIASDSPPTYRQLQAHFGVGSSAIFDAVSRLRDRGALLPSDGLKGIKAINFKSTGELTQQVKDLKEHNLKLLEIVDNLAAQLQEATGQE